MMITYTCVSVAVGVVFFFFFFFCFVFVFFFKQKTAYEILTCDWSSDVCSSDLYLHGRHSTTAVVADLPDLSGTDGAV